MVMYSCPRCGYSNTIKTKIKAHFMRKNICSATCSDIPIDECYREVLGEEYPKIEKGITKVSQEVSQSNTEVSQEVSQSITKVSQKVSQSKCFECEDCGETFNKKNNYYRHRKHYCKERDIFTKNEVMGLLADSKNKDKLIKELKNQIEVLLTKVGDTNYNQQNIIVINAFGNENMKYIKEGDIAKMINEGPMSSIPRLLKQIHFNPSHKENHNVFIPNKKQKYAKIYNGDKWELQEKNRTIDDMTNKALKTIKYNFDENDNKHWKKIMTKIDDDEKIIVDRIEGETELMILNNQDIVDKKASIEKCEAGKNSIEI